MRVLAQLLGLCFAGCSCDELAMGICVFSCYGLRVGHTSCPDSGTDAVGVFTLCVLHAVFGGSHYLSYYSASCVPITIPSLGVFLPVGKGSDGMRCCNSGVATT